MTTLTAIAPFAGVANIVDECDHVVGQIYGRLGDSPEQVLALARVMAAGPRLVEALRELAAHVEQNTIGGDDMCGSAPPSPPWGSGYEARHPPRRALPGWL